MKKLICLLVLLVFGAYLYGKYIEPNNLKVHEYTILNENIPEGFNGVKVIHFSDLLYNNNDEFLEKLTTKINESHPDIVVFSGDLLKSAFNEDKKDIIVEKLSTIEAKLGKYFITGENDTQTSEEILLQSGFENMNNNSKLIFNNDNTPIMISSFVKDNENNYITDEKYNFSIILTHMPDNYDSISLPNGYSLILSGHALKGEINVPFYGNLIKIDGAKTYYGSHYETTNKEMYISNGLGNIKTPIRLFNTPSFNVYLLKNK